MFLLLPVRCVQGIRTVHETIDGDIIHQTREEVRVPLTGWIPWRGMGRPVRGGLNSSVNRVI